MKREKKRVARSFVLFCFVVNEWKFFHLARWVCSVSLGPCRKKGPSCCSFCKRGVNTSGVCSLKGCFLFLLSSLFTPPEYPLIFSPSSAREDYYLSLSFFLQGLRNFVKGKNGNLLSGCAAVFPPRFQRAWERFYRYSGVGLMIQFFFFGVWQRHGQIVFFSFALPGGVLVCLLLSSFSVLLRLFPWRLAAYPLMCVSVYYGRASEI